MDQERMRLAIQLAEMAAQDGEVPVGAIITLPDGTVVGQGRNRREKQKNALCHAELEAINEACRKLGGWRLWQCTMYVTLEPCPMCAGAIVNARIARVVYGAKDLKNGACGSALDVFSMPNGFRPETVSGVLEDECTALMQSFFQRLRTQPPKVQTWKKNR